MKMFLILHIILFPMLTCGLQKNICIGKIDFFKKFNIIIVPVEISVGEINHDIQ